MSDSEQGFTIPADDVEAALGRGVARAVDARCADVVESPISMTELERPEDVESEELLLLTDQTEARLNGVYRRKAKRGLDDH